MEAGDLGGRWEETDQAVAGDVATGPLGRLTRLLACLDDVDLVARYTVADRVLPRGLVLDAGCGDGRGAALLGREGRSVVAIDRCPVPFTPRGIKTMQGDLASLELEAGRFAGIACLDVLDGTEAPRPLLAALRRALAPDGVLVVSLRGGRLPAVGPDPSSLVDESLREAFPHVQRLEGGLVIDWRASPPSAVSQTGDPSNGGGTPQPTGRRFLIASVAPTQTLPWLLMPGPAFDLEALREDVADAVQLVRQLSVDLARAREDLQQTADLRARLVEAEQDIGRMPDLRATLRKMAAERDALADLLRRALRGRPYVQLAVVLEALHQGGVPVNDATREALHALLSEFDRRADLKDVMSHEGQLRVHDLIRWSVSAPPNDPGRPLLRRHLPVLAALSKRVGRLSIVAPVSQS